jgi:hypothetical protein
MISAAITGIFALPFRVRINLARVSKNKTPINWRLTDNELEIDLFAFTLWSSDGRGDAVWLGRA